MIYYFLPVYPLGVCEHILTYKVNYTMGDHIAIAMFEGIFNILVKRQFSPVEDDNVMRILSSGNIKAH